MWTTCSASINGGGSLTQEGTGTLILTGPNTYSGGITINSGSTLQVGNGTTGGLGCTSSITNYGSLVLDTNAYYLGAISGGGSLTVSGGTVYLNAANAYSGVTIWGGGTLELCGTAASINYNVSDYGTLAFGCSGTTTYSGVISGGGSLTQNGGTLILTGANTYIGGTTVSEGTLQLGSQDAAEDSTVIVDSPGALGFASGIVTFNIGGLSGNGNIDLEDSASNPVTIQVGGDNADTIYSGVFSGDGSLTKTGSGILILSPPSGGNTYTGGTTVSEGTLEAKCTAALPGTGQVSVAPCATLAVAVGAAGDWNSGANDDIATLLRSATFDPNSNLGIDTTDGNFTYTGTIADPGATPLGLVVLGTNTLTLDPTLAPNSYTGDTLIASGTLTLGTVNAIPSAPALAIDANGTLDLNGLSPTFAGLIDGPNGGGTVTDNNPNPAGATLILAPTGGATPSFSGTIEDGQNGGGPVSVTIEATGTGSEQILAGSNNSYSGLTEVASGTLGAGAEYAFSPASDMEVDSGAILDMNGFDNEVNTLSGSGTVENSTDTSATLGVGNDSTGSTFTGTLTDAGGGTGLLGLAKLGTDTITIAGTNSYSGPTIVEGGILDVATAFGDSPVQLAGGQLSGANAPAATSVATTVTLSSSYPSSPPVFGESVTFYATVGTTNGNFGTPSGSVIFYDEATGAESDPITLDSNGCASWTITNPDAEDHYIVATYTSDTGTYVDGTCDEFDETVNQADTTTAVVVPGSDPTFGNVTLAATVTVNSPGSGTPTGTVEFWDGTTDLGTGNYDSTGGDWTLSANTLAPGAHQITAVYNGDDNFNTSQSQATTITVDGSGLSLGNSLSVGWGTINEGTTATLSGTVTGLNGAAFSVTVNWGDSTSSDSDNGGQPFYFTAGTTSFSVNHYYGNCGSDTISNITVTASDGRQLSLYTAGGTGLPLTVNGVAPIVYLDPPLPAGENYDPGTQYTVSAYGVSPDPSSVSYQWVLSDGTALAATPTTLTLADGTVLNGSEVQVWGDQYGGVNVTVSSSGAARMVNLGDPNFSQGFVDDTASLPAVTITETDPNQTVTAPGVATFDVQAQWAAGTQYWFPSVFYNTIDSSGAAPAGYVSTYGPQQVDFGDTVYNALTGMNTADGTVHVSVPGVLGGVGSVMLQLTHSLLCQVVANGASTLTATATIQQPQLQLWLTDAENPNGISVANGGSANVKIGETVTLSVQQVVNGVAGANQPADWRLPNANMAVGAYDPTLLNGQVTQILGSCGNPMQHCQTVSNTSVVSFEFVAGGTFGVSATVGGVTLTASLNVVAPTVNMVATVQPGSVLSIGTVAAGKQTSIGPVPGYGGVLDQLYMLPLVWTALNPNDNQGQWRYAFLQTATCSATVTIPGTSTLVLVHQKVAGVYEHVAPTTGRDGPFPCNPYAALLPSAGYFNSLAEINSLLLPWGDRPSISIYDDGTSSYNLTATTYLMCEAMNNGSPLGGCGWAPVAEITWSYSMSANWAPATNAPTFKVSQIVVSGQNAKPNIGYPFGTPSGPPQWPAQIGTQLKNTKFPYNFL